MKKHNQTYLLPYYEKYWRSIVSDEFKDLDLRTSAVSELFPVSTKSNILDFGCGRGETLRQLSQANPNAKLYGIDISETALLEAKKKVPKARFGLCSEGKPLPLKTGSIDFVIAMDVIEHVYDTEWMFNELSRVTKKGGKILISTPYCGLIKNLVVALVGFEKVYDPLGPHIRFYTKKSLKELLDKVGFQTIMFDTFGRFYPLSKGMYLLAKKTKNKSITFDRYVA